MKPKFLHLLHFLHRVILWYRTTVPIENPQIWRWMVRENPVDFPEPWAAGLLTEARMPDTPDLLCG